MSSIRYHGLVKKSRGRLHGGIRSNSSLRKIIRSYLDDNAKGLSHPHGLIYTDGRSSLIGCGSTPQVQGNDYQLGAIPTVNLFGYIRNYCSNPDLIDLEKQDETLNEISNWWEQSTDKRKIKATHFVFSINPKTSEKLKEKDYDVHASLIDSVEETLLRFQSKFYPEESIGAIYGVHHDREHTHAHVLFHPITSSGNRINLSHNALENRSGIKCRIDYQGYLKQQFNQCVYDKYLEAQIEKNVDHVQGTYAYESSLFASLQDFFSSGGDLSNSSKESLSWLEERREEILCDSNAIERVSVAQNTLLNDREEGDDEALVSQYPAIVSAAESCEKLIDSRLERLESLREHLCREYSMHESAVTLNFDCQELEIEQEEASFTSLEEHEKSTINLLKESLKKSDDLSNKLAVDNKNADDTFKEIALKHTDLGVSSIAIEDIQCSISGTLPSFAEREENRHINSEFHSRSTKEIRQKIQQEINNVCTLYANKHQNFDAAKDANKLFEPTDIDWKSGPMVKVSSIRKNLSEKNKLHPSTNLLSVDLSDIIYEHDIEM